MEPDDPVTREGLKEVAERWALGASAVDWNGILDALSRQVLEMLSADRRRLLNNLYRLDVSEAKVRGALNSGKDAAGQARLLAELILAREIQKARTRAQG